MIRALSALTKIIMIFFSFSSKCRKLTLFHLDLFERHFLVPSTFFLNLARYFQHCPTLLSMSKVAWRVYGHLQQINLQRASLYAPPKFS